MTVPFPLPSYVEADAASIALQAKPQKREKSSKSQAVPKVMQIPVGQSDKATVLRAGVLASLLFTDERDLVHGLHFCND